MEPSEASDKGKQMIRVPVRIAGKLVSFRIEEPTLEDIDRMARSQGMDRSHWIRHACHVQLVLDIIENGDGHEPHEPETPDEVTLAVVDAQGLSGYGEPAVAQTPPDAVTTGGGPALPPQGELPSDVRPNRWA